MSSKILTTNDGIACISIHFLSHRIHFVREFFFGSPLPILVTLKAEFYTIFYYAMLYYVRFFYIGTLIYDKRNHKNSW